MNRLHTALERNGGRTLLGAACYSHDPAFVEICAHLGYQAIWIEMEHATITFDQAAELCRTAAGSGMLTMIRIADTRRENVLKAAECGPDIIDVPMIESVSQLDELRYYARFAPEGGRGFFSISRALNYGIVPSVVDEQRKLNTDLCLMAQIETSAAVDRLEELAAAPGIDLFVGPADLASSLGHAGDTAHPDVLAAARTIVASARRQNKLIATACSPADYPFWLDQGIDLLFCTNNISCLRKAAEEYLEDARKALTTVLTSTTRA
ncbi:MAG: aldolase/citrate lyase family protein [Acidobacteriota bacterium]